MEDASLPAPPGEAQQQQQQQQQQGQLTIDADRIQGAVTRTLARLGMTQFEGAFQNSSTTSDDPNLVSGVRRAEMRRLVRRAIRQGSQQASGARSHHVMTTQGGTSNVMWTITAMQERHLEHGDHHHHHLGDDEGHEGSNHHGMESSYDDEGSQGESDPRR